MFADKEKSAAKMGRESNHALRVRVLWVKSLERQRTCDEEDEHLSASRLALERRATDVLCQGRAPFSLQPFSTCYSKTTQQK